jgi:Chromo (CHRromatin Organisation MOdifier) domain
VRSSNLGYSAKDNTWEPVTNLENARDAITKYHHDRNAPKKKSPVKPKTTRKSPAKLKSPVKKATPKPNGRKPTARKTKAKTASVEEEDDEDVPQYEIGSILKHKKGKKQLVYLIRWEGFTEEDDTWEPESNLLETAGPLLTLYKEANELQVLEI